MDDLNLSTLDEKLSIVIPVLDSLEYTKMCIDSLNKYTPKAEIIVVNNGSQPDTKQYLDSLKHIRVIHWDENRGVSKAWNAGLKIATRDVLCVLNNDVTVNEMGLQRLVEAAIKTGISGDYGFCFTIDWTLEYGTLNEEEADVLGGYCLVFRRDVWNKVGEFDELFTPACWEDNDWCLRAKQAGCKWQIVNGQINHYCSKTLNRVFDLYILGEQQRAKFTHKWNMAGIGLGERVLVRYDDDLNNLHILQECVKEIRKRKPLAKIQVLSNSVEHDDIPECCVVSANKEFKNYTQEVCYRQYIKQPLVSFVVWGADDKQLRNLIKNTNLLKAEYIVLKKSYGLNTEAVNEIFKQAHGDIKIFINENMVVETVCD